MGRLSGTGNIYGGWSCRAAIHAKNVSWIASGSLHERLLRVQARERPTLRCEVRGESARRVAPGPRRLRVARARRRDALCRQSRKPARPSPPIQEREADEGPPQDAGVGRGRERLARAFVRERSGRAAAREPVDPSLRPPFNVSGAFTMLYPCIGLRVHERALDLCCTTSPHLLEEFAFFGAYRSARLTRAAFGSLVELLGHLGHAEPTRRLKDLPRVPFTRIARFRQLDSTWRTALEQFFLGTSRELLTHLVLALLEKPAARRHAEQVQAALQLLKCFWDEESEPLRQALVAGGRGGDRFLSQTERDPLFLEVRALRRRSPWPRASVGTGLFEHQPGTHARPRTTAVMTNTRNPAV